MARSGAAPAGVRALRCCASLARRPPRDGSGRRGPPGGGRVQSLGNGGGGGWGGSRCGGDGADRARAPRNKQTPAVLTNPAAKRGGLAAPPPGVIPAAVPSRRTPPQRLGTVLAAPRNTRGVPGTGRSSPGCPSAEPALRSASSSARRGASHLLRQFGRALVRASAFLFLGWLGVCFSFYSLCSSSARIGDLYW